MHVQRNADTALQGRLIMVQCNTRHHAYDAAFPRGQHVRLTGDCVFNCQP